MKAAHYILLKRLPCGYPLPLWILFFCWNISLGQGLYNTSAIHLNNATLHVDGEISNDGQLINKGFIEVTADWNNSGNYSGNGELHLTGNFSQNIFHNDQKVYSLQIKGKGPKMLRGKISVSRELHLLEGKLYVSQQDELFLKQAAAIFGGSVKSFVDGPLTVEGDGYKFFPVGKNGIYAPIEFLNVKGDEGRYSMEVFENAPLITVDNVIIKNDFYWQRKDLDENFPGSAIAVGFDPTQFTDVNKITLLVGSDWDKPFQPITDLEYAAETGKLITRSDVSSSIIMLGEKKNQEDFDDFYFSTALSPNASNPANRAVRIFGTQLKETDFNFKVFNRWGLLLFESSSLKTMSTNGWDGSNNGESLSTGPYPFILTVVNKAGKRIEKKGIISIIN